MQTLQDVIDAVSVMPGQYGKKGWVDCPLAKEVLSDIRPWIERNSKEAAHRLGCSTKHTNSFICWWDALCARALVPPYDVYNLSKARQSGKALRKYGYRVPDEKQMVELIRERNSQKES